MFSIVSRLWFDGRRGIIRHGGFEEKLTAMPEGFPGVVEIDFMPACCVAEAREKPNGKRDMSPEEQRVAWALMKGLADEH